MAWSSSGRLTKLLSSYSLKLRSNYGSAVVSAASVSRGAHSRVPVVTHARLPTLRSIIAEASRQIPTIRHFSSSSAMSKKAKDISINFTFHDDSVVTVQGAEGDSLLDLVVDNDIDIDGFGACEGTLACSTCHVVLSQEDYDRMPDQPTDEEFDMLDLAYGLTDTSRLGCQIFCTKDLNNLMVDVPPGIADARSWRGNERGPDCGSLDGKWMKHGGGKTGGQEEETAGSKRALMTVAPSELWNGILIGNYIAQIKLNLITFCETREQK